MGTDTKGGTGSKHTVLEQYCFFLATCRLGTWPLQCELWILTGTAVRLGDSDILPFLCPVQIIIICMIIITLDYYLHALLHEATITL